MTCRALKEVVSDKTTRGCQNIYLCCLCPGVVLLHFGLPLLGGGSWINAEIGCGCLHGICISWRTFPGIIRSGILGCEPQAETLSHCQYRNQNYSPCELKLRDEDFSGLEPESHCILQCLWWFSFIRLHKYILPWSLLCLPFSPGIPREGENM